MSMLKYLILPEFVSSLVILVIGFMVAGVHPMEGVFIVGAGFLMLLGSFVTIQKKVAVEEDSAITTFGQRRGRK